MALVVAGAAAGTAFEWYDFFVFGSLASIIAKTFTAGSPLAGYLFALGAFAAGFFVRPFGALFFGRLGDRHGRKRAFFVTLVGMGAATVAIGFLPTAAQAGILAPTLLVVLRVVQGFAMGGEYGGAAIYVAEHASPDRRGFLTSWIQTSASVGLVLSLGVILLSRTLMGEARFEAWGWRVPFWASALLLAASLVLRARLGESPVFLEMKAKRRISAAPLAEAFRGHNLRRMALALVAILFAQGAVWYTANFYAQFFLERVVRVPASVVNGLMVAGVVASAPLYVLFGWLSDRVGRKPVLVLGMALFLVAAVPVFRAMSAVGDPAFEAASRATPVQVRSDPRDCAFQFDPLGLRPATGGCDLARATLSGLGVPFRNLPGAGATVVQVGAAAIAVPPAAATRAGAAAATAALQARLRTALKAAGYPSSAPASTNLPFLFGLLFVLMVAAAAIYGPQAAALVELFPAPVRYTAFSAPYNIGTGWVGGFLPITAFSLVAATGDRYAGLAYPLAFTAISLVATVTLLPETRGRNAQGDAEPQGEAAPAVPTPSAAGSHLAESTQ